MIIVRLLIASLVWGANIIVVKWNSSYFDALFLVTLKLLIASLTLMIFLIIKKHKLVKVSWKSLWINTNCINVINFMCTYFSIGLLSGCSSATLNCLSPVIMAIILLCHRHKMTIYEYGYLFLTLFGFFITIQFSIDKLSWGHYVMLAGLLFYNIGNYRIRRDEDVEMIIYNFYMMLMAFVEMVIIMIVFHRPVVLSQVDSGHFWLFILTSGVGYAFIQSTYLKAIQEIGLMTTSFFLSLNPIFTYVLSIWLLQENIQWYSLVGFFFIIVSMIIKYKYQRNR